MPAQQPHGTRATERDELRTDRHRQRVLALFVALWLAVGALCVLLAIFSPSL